MTNRESWFDRMFRRTRYKLTMDDTWEGEKASYSGVSFPAMVNHGFRKNELIFSCISKTANTAAQVGLDFYRGDKELEDHPVQRLIQKPNPYMSEFDLWVAIIIYQKLAGVAYFEKERSRAGLPVALWPLRPDWVTPILIKDQRRVGISGYEYKPDGFATAETLRPEDVIAFPLWDPMGLFSFWPPVAVAARTGDVDNTVTDYIKMFFQKGGTPPGLLKTVQRLQDTQVTDIRRRWRERYGGSEHWLEPAVLDSDATYQVIGSSFKDMGFDQLDARNEARICMVLDVPPILVGAKIGLDRSTFSNYGEARKAWWEDSLKPMYENLEDVIENQLIAEFDSTIETEWNFGKVSALQEDQTARWQRATAAWNANAITLNEFREQVGLPSRPDGDVFKSSMAAPVTEPVTDEEPGAKSFKAVNPPDDEDRRKAEKLLSGKMIKYFEKQQTALLENIDAG